MTKDQPWLRSNGFFNFHPELETSLDLSRMDLPDDFYNRMDGPVQKALDERALREENRSLRDQLSRHYSFDNIIGKSSSMVQIFEAIKKIADSHISVLIAGASGTGKELIAQSIHANSTRRGRPFSEGGGKVFDVDLPLAPQDHQPLDQILELADVARPVVVADPVQSPLGDADGASLALLPVHRFEEMLGEQRNVLPAVSERRNFDREDADPIVEIGAENPIGHFLAQVPVRRRDDSHVDLLGPARAETLELSVLQHAQQLPLDLER